MQGSAVPCQVMEVNDRGKLCEHRRSIPSTPERSSILPHEVIQAYALGLNTLKLIMM